MLIFHLNLFHDKNCEIDQLFILELGFFILFGLFILFPGNNCMLISSISPTYLRSVNWEIPRFSISSVLFKRVTQFSS